MLLACTTVGIGITAWWQPRRGAAVAPQSHQPTYDPAADPEFQAAVQLRESGQLAESGRAFARLSRTAAMQGNKTKQARVLLAQAGNQLHQFAYRDASRSYQELLRLAAELQDEHLTGAAFSNLAELHMQLGDFTAAQRNAEAAVALLRHCNRPASLIRAELQLGSIRAHAGLEHQAMQAYRDAITLAADTGDTEDEALAWLILGQTLANARDLSRAEAAYLRAYRLSVLNHGPLLDTVRAKLAELEWLNGDALNALDLLDRVLSGRPATQLGFPEYQILFERAQMLAALARDSEALAAYRKAVAAAGRWRRQALPGEVANAGSVESVHSVYAGASDFIAGLAYRRHNQSLSREALNVLATNRAADLREERTLAWHRDGRLPPRYYELLTELRTAEANLILSDTRKPSLEASVVRIRADLSVLETDLAMTSEKSDLHGEKNERSETLDDIQRRLSDDDALFSFSLGKQRSWLWALTRNSLQLVELPKAETLEQTSSAWAGDVRQGRDADVLGHQLAGELFGQVRKTTWRKRNWMVVNDGTLFVNVPLAVLPDLSQELPSQEPSMTAVPLVQNHHVRYLASEFSLSSNPVSPGRQIRFAGVGDPVYNLADSRYQTGTTTRFSPLSHGANASLARLVGSGAEIRASASLFPNSEMLTGTAARTESLGKIFETNPTVVHLAVHVVSPPGRPEEAALALSLGSDRLPELLTSEEILTYRVPGSLVVMSGCESQQGKAVPGVGVKGLSRAWLLAGASAVIASTWPMPDENGRFFCSFYEHLVVNSRFANSLPELAAASLADAQNEMRASTGFRRKPAFWAAYTVISKE